MADIEHTVKKPNDKLKRDADVKKFKDRTKDKTKYTPDEIEAAVRAWARGL